MTGSVKFRALLVDGPFDGQDILISDQEINDQAFVRNGCRYVMGQRDPKHQWLKFHFSPSIARFDKEPTAQGDTRRKEARVIVPPSRRD